MIACETKHCLVVLLSLGSYIIVKCGKNSSLLKNTGTITYSLKVFRNLRLAGLPMHNHNNEFILITYIVRRKMADFERCELEIGLEFGHLSFDKRKNFSEGSFEPKKYAQVI